ncbi:MAG: hypothetical protein KF799_09940 [Bdellovibrionales bacterium]|nr:hypothetical protein [Bdellovibrionales bacterium]
MIWSLILAVLVGLAAFLSSVQNRTVHFDQMSKGMRDRKISVLQTQNLGSSMLTAGVRAPASGACESDEVRLQAIQGGAVCVKRVLLCGSATLKADQACVMQGGSGS